MNSFKHAKWALSCVVTQAALGPQGMNSSHWINVIVIPQWAQWVVIVRHNYCISKRPSRLVSSRRQVFKDRQHPFITEASAFQQCQRGPTTEDYHTIGSTDSNDNWKTTKVPTSGPVSGPGGASDRMCNSSHLAQTACLRETGGKSCTWASLTLLLASGKGEREGQREADADKFRDFAERYILMNQINIPRAPLSHSVPRHDTVA